MPITKTDQAYNKLESLKDIGDSFDVKEAVTEIYGDYNLFNNDSFGVLLSKAKKKFARNTFRTVKGQMTKLI